jgi:hypothetical protein
MFENTTHYILCSMLLRSLFRTVLILDSELADRILDACHRVLLVHVEDSTAILGPL